ncbi:TPA: hypothetical protein DIV49_00070 [Candidatus Saccharibacteria bacterium]|nr:hypothetical protein [Candidatus Saccharibacteria bacterium]HRJ90899.1 alpha/beta hydrolase [Candidatus Saccharibacteria bacterium]
MTEYEISNRNGLKIAILVEGQKAKGKLVFIAHGQKGSMQQPHIQAFTDAFLANDYTVVRFDATHSLNKSEGELEDVTYDGYIADLEDVIAWAQDQEWFTQPFALCGHSMGAQSTAWYAEHHPEDVSLLLPMAPTISYDLWVNTRSAEEIDNWKAIGYQEVESQSMGKSVRIGWQVNESLKKFDVLAHADKLTMPVLNIVGEFDEPCPPRNQEIFMNAIASDDKTLTILPGFQHSYRDADSMEYSDKLSQVMQAIDEWLRRHV